MIQPQPEAIEHMRRMLVAIKGMCDEANLKADESASWATLPLLQAYEHVAEAIVCLEQHQAVLSAIEAKK